MKNRVIHEQNHYTKDDLIAMACNYAKLQIIDSFYVGDIGEQTVKWQSDGSLIIVTSHAPGDLADWRTKR